MSGRVQATMPQHIMAKHAVSSTLSQGRQPAVQGQQGQVVPSQQQLYTLPGQQDVPMPSQQQSSIPGQRPGPLSSQQETHVPSQQERAVTSQQERFVLSQQQMPVSSQQVGTVPAPMAPRPVMYVKPPWAIDDPFTVEQVCVRRRKFAHIVTIVQLPGWCCCTTRLAPSNYNCCMLLA